jgi:very-short-patch-repair endonuclease
MITPGPGAAGIVITGLLSSGVHLAEVAGGIRSATEGDLRDLIIGAGLPMPMFNARLYVGQKLIAVADAWWPQARVAVEVDSREWHLAPEDWERTLRHDRAMGALGIVVLHLTPGQIRDEPARVAADISSAIGNGRAGGPVIRAVPTAG